MKKTTPDDIITVLEMMTSRASKTGPKMRMYRAYDGDGVHLELDINQYGLARSELEPILDAGEFRLIRVPNGRLQWCCAAQTGDELYLRVKRVAKAVGRLAVRNVPLLTKAVMARQAAAVC